MFFLNCIIVLVLVLLVVDIDWIIGVNDIFGVWLDNMLYIKLFFFFFFEFIFRLDVMLCNIFMFVFFKFLWVVIFVVNVNKVMVNRKCLLFVKEVKKKLVYYKMILFSLFLLLVKLGKIFIFLIFFKVYFVKI